MKISLIVAALAFSSCGKLNSVLDVPNKMDNLNSSLDETKRLTILGQMTAKLEDTKNYKVIAPVPFDLNAAAKLAAENFKINEVVPWVYNLLQKVNEAKFEDNYGVSPKDNPTAAAEFEQNKLGTISAITAVCGFLPESMIDQMVAAVASGDEDSATILSMFAMRAYFINNVLMKEKYAPSKLTSIGGIEKAIQYNQQVERLLRLPYAKDISVKITGFEVTPDFNEAMTYGLDFNSARLNWNSIANGMDQYLKVAQYSNGDDQTNSQRSRQQTALKQIQQGQAAWAVTAP